jgi:hypothetical protein
MCMYEFDEQLDKGHGYETRLDKYFSRWYSVHPIEDMAVQRMGIDRRFTGPTGAAYSVEYKTDERAGETGNVFIETVSVDCDNKLGWAYTSCAQILAYYIPLLQKIYLAYMTNVKDSVKGWSEVYPIRRIPNRGYYTIGLLVPIHEFERICFRVLETAP